MSLWDRLDELSDSELRNVVAVAAQVLAESETTGDAEAGDAMELSPLTASRRIAPELAAVDPSLSAADVQRVLEDDRGARELALAVIGEIRRVPELAAEVEARLAERARKLSAPELLMATGALLVLAIKLKEIRFVQSKERGSSSSEVAMNFYESSAVLKDVIAHIIRAFRPS
jgi:hypothetical protein